MDATPQVETHDSRIVIGLITCRNLAGLAKLLHHIGRADLTGVERLIVVDNDPEHSAAELVSQLELKIGSLPRPELFHEQNAGIPFARNRVFAEALGRPFDYLVMLDDDEYPTETWLSELISAARRTGADVIGGKVVPVLEVPPEAPVQSIDFEHKIGIRLGGRDFVGATSSIMFSRKVIEDFTGRWFSQAYAMTGGSDTEFLRRVFDHGYHHCMVPTSVAYEDIPAGRINKSWLLKRAYRFGNGIVRVRIGKDGYLRTATTETIRIATLLSLAALLALQSGRSPRKRFEAELLSARARGKTDAFFGRTYEEYAQRNYRPG